MFICTDVATPHQRLLSLPIEQFEVTVKAISGQEMDRRGERSRCLPERPRQSFSVMGFGFYLVAYPFRCWRCPVNRHIIYIMTQKNWRKIRQDSQRDRQTCWATYASPTGVCFILRRE
jgi:hypothetical protein